MATIQLLDNHRLKSDSRQWVFQKTNGKKDDDGELVYTNIGYYTTLTSAVNASYGYFIRKSDADGALELLQDSKCIFNKMVEMLSPVAEITEK